MNDLQKELQRTTTVLRTVLNSLDDLTSNTQSTVPTTEANASMAPRGRGLSVSASSSTRPSSGSSSTSSAAEDFKQAFPGLCSRNVTNKRPNPGEQKPEPKKKKPLLGYVPFRVPETWTHDICMLGRCNEESTPDRERMEILMQAGLGKMKLTFPNKNATYKDVQTFLEGKFPKLKAGGGFHVLRAAGGGGGQRPLSLLLPGKEGYSVPFLKERLGQAIAYIRPLQVDLDESPVELEVEDSPKVNCVNCGLAIHMTSIKDHQKECGGGSSSQCQPSQVQSSQLWKQPQAHLSSREHESASYASVGISKFFSSANTSGPVFDTLVEMFPDVPSNHIVSAIECAGSNTNKAVNVLLGIDCNGSDESDDELMRSVFEIEDSSVQPQHTLDHVISKHKKSLMISGCQRISIRRENLWRESVALFKNPMFKPTSSPMVTFEGEQGIDAGGLRKEYGTLLLKKLFSTEANLFEGKDNRKLPIYSMEGIQSKLFQVSGKMVAYIMVHMDIGIPWLSPCVYDYIMSGSLEHASSYCSIDDLCDYDIQDLTEKVNAASSQEELEKLKNDELLLDNLTNAGWLYDLTMDNRSLAMQTLLIHCTLQKRKMPLDEFIKGLDTLGIPSLIRKYPGLMKKYFVASESPLTSGDLIGLLCAKPVNENEEKSYGYLLKSIKKIEEDNGSMGLERFLHFMTGLTTLPPLGLDKNIDIEFVCLSRSFFAETCALNLQVPTTHETFDEFMEKVKEACHNDTGFGCA